MVAFCYSLALANRETETAKSRKTIGEEREKEDDKEEELDEGWWLAGVNGEQRGGGVASQRGENECSLRFEYMR
ncbi:hypothetical protein HAX54_027568, partial [Datura stramonium]|nr:hypothetical protein [Datura stramonium]